MCWLSAFRLGRRTIRQHPNGREIAPGHDRTPELPARAPEARAAKLEDWVFGGCGGFEGRTLMREGAGLFMLRNPQNQTCHAFS